MLINIDITEEIIEKYYKILENISKKNVNYSFKNLEISDEELEIQLNNNIIGRFIVDNLKEKIVKMNFRYKVTFDKNFIMIFSENKILDSIKIKSLVQLIIYLQNIGNNLKLNAYFYLTPSIRKVNNSCFNTKAVNGGYTKLNQNRKLVVWRKEDGLKVFIHELIHYFDIDSFFRKYRDINEYLNLTTNHDYVFEAFTDFFAINYYMVYLSLINNNYTREFLHSNFNEQYNFSLTQGFKVIKYSKLDQGNIIKNTTNVYCYYLLKLYIMIYLRNKDLKKIDIKNVISKSYELYTNKIMSRYIKKLNLDNKLNMAFKQIYL